jgi:heme/copper-type cytochrome/quinol oxidase subunit 4
VKGPLSGVLAVISAIVAIFCFYRLQTTADSNTMYMVGGIAFAVLMVIFGVMFMSGRINKTDDIHITE